MCVRSWEISLNMLLSNIRCVWQTEGNICHTAYLRIVGAPLGFQLFRLIYIHSVHRQIIIYCTIDVHFARHLLPGIISVSRIPTCRFIYHDRSDCITIYLRYDRCTLSCSWLSARLRIYIKRIISARASRRYNHTYTQIHTVKVDSR